MEKETFTHDFKSAIFDEMQKEVLDEYGVPYCKWDSLIDAYKVIRHQIGIDEFAYYDILESMYKARKTLDNMSF
ncbi:MAG: hypothetical protein E7257_11185 [Lachnospiraceae bacterium]|nr:hypothetical protein [Lachnospiraceae bacterium]